MIKTIAEFITRVQRDLRTWDAGVKPWFRGESGNVKPLCPKIAEFEEHQENYVLQSFRRQAGGFANVPHRHHTDEWLFLAQHYGIPTRLLDWTEGALLALYFAVNGNKSRPRVFMLNPRKLNDLAGVGTRPLNYPLTWAQRGETKGGDLYIALAWQNRELDRIQEGLQTLTKINLDIPVAFPATYQDQRMIAQRSCFTIHGLRLEPMQEILRSNNIPISECLFKYSIDRKARGALLQELSILGVSAATIFPDLDHLAVDLRSVIEGS